MEPTLHDGERWLALRRPHRRLITPDRMVAARCAIPLQRSDTLIVKRVAHVGGEEVFQPAHVIPVHEQWTLDGEVIRGTVPAGCVYLRSDNPPARDSADLGPVHHDKIEALLVWRLATSAAASCLSARSSGGT